MRRLDIDWVQRPARGERICGDLVLLVELDARCLLAVIDGLGHGPRAAEASEAAAAFIRAHAEEPLDHLLRGCDGAIRSTRGVAATVIRIDRETLELEHAGVGNVELVARTAEAVAPVPQAGVIGGRMRKVIATRHQLHAGDLLALFSDGISRRLRLEDQRRDSARATAEAILRNHGKDHDDASCAVVLV